MTDNQVIHDEIESIVRKIMQQPLTIDEGMAALTGDFGSEDLELQVSKAIADEVTKLFMRQFAEQAERVQRCPVCDGKGMVPPLFYQSQTGGGYTEGADQTCRTCNGATILSSERIAELQGEISHD